MLRAERTGRLMSPSRVLSRRRCKRRLRRASCWRILVFTRNLLGLVFDVASLLHETPQKPERFRVFGKKFRKIATDFAYLGIRSTGFRWHKNNRRRAQIFVEAHSASRAGSGGYRSDE